MTKLRKLPREGTKDRAKLEAMRRVGPPHGAEHRKLQDIEGSNWGTYKNDGARYAEILGGELVIWGSGPSRRYWVKMPGDKTRLGDRTEIVEPLVSTRTKRAERQAQKASRPAEEKKRQEEAYRKVLGNWGEAHALRLLKDAKFTIEEHLNVRRQNHPGGDVLASRDGYRYFFSVKARDRFGKDEDRFGNRKPNPEYNIYPSKVITAAQAYSAKPAWLVIRADRRDNTLCSYWGFIDEIPPSKSNPSRVAVPMSEEAISEYCRRGRCLASNVFDETIAQVFRGKLY